MARPERFERPTPWFVAKYSIQLSYGRATEGAHYTDSEQKRQGFRTIFFSFGGKGERREKRGLKKQKANRKAGPEKAKGQS